MSIEDIDRRLLEMEVKQHVIARMIGDTENYLVSRIAALESMLQLHIDHRNKLATSEPAPDDPTTRTLEEEKG